jgi:hypothetical protein
MNSIDLPKLRNAEYLQYVKDFSGIITLNNPSALQIDVKISELESLYKKALANEKKQDLLLLNERRDNAINGLYYFLLGHSYHFEADKKQKAQLLLDNMVLYGMGNSSLNYQAKTAALNNLINDWENKPELTDAVAFLNLSAWINEMKTANDLFQTTYLSRKQKYGNANPEKIKSKREEVNAAYYTLRDTIDALHLLVEMPQSPYTTVMNQLDALTDQYNVLLANRKDTSAPENGFRSEM